eukprot:1150667-Pelagomonas_calceolata.AAC.3
MSHGRRIMAADVSLQMSYGSRSWQMELCNQLNLLFMVQLLGSIMVHSCERFVSERHSNSSPGVDTPQHFM